MQLLKSSDDDNEGIEHGGKCGAYEPVQIACKWISCILFLLLCAVPLLWFLSRPSPVTVIPPGYCEEPFNEMPHVSNRSIAGLREWASALVAQMSATEKYTLVHGVGWGSDGQSLPSFYIGNILAIPRLGIPSINMQDAGQGFRTLTIQSVGETTAWPCALAVAAGWDPAITEVWANSMGEEFRLKGANVALGPAVNVNRVAANGRNAEYISGEDPHLGVPLVAAYVRGMQAAGVAAVVKHFVLNQQETHRDTVNSMAHERTMWEQYYPPFQAAVNAGVAAVMCSYNQVNGHYACDNHQTLSIDLKKRMGFNGWVMSDWWALKTVDGFMAGTDQIQPGQGAPFAAQSEFEKAVSSEHFDDMATRVLVGMAQAGVWGKANDTIHTCRLGCDCDKYLYDVHATSPTSVKLARDIAAGSAVLLKNDQISSNSSVLPLRKGQKVAVLGSACFQHPNIAAELNDWTAGNYYEVGGSGRVLSMRSVSIIEGLENRGLSLHVSASEDIEKAKRAMTGAEVALVCGGATTAESFDRKSLSLDQEDFISNIAHIASIPVVVLALAPGAILTPWRDHVAAVVVMFLSGQETGNAMGDVLLGNIDPSGRLPVTFPSAEADVIKPCEQTICPYIEGLRGGWHVYDSKPVAYPFGHGLSYNNYSVTLEHNWQVESPGLRSFTVKVSNGGDVAGRQVLQLYVGFPSDSLAAREMPKIVLRGYSKTPKLLPGESCHVTFNLTSRDLSFWNEATHSWEIVTGRFTTYLGTSSRHHLLCGAFVENTTEVEPMESCS